MMAGSGRRYGQHQVIAFGKSLRHLLHHIHRLPALDRDAAQRPRNGPQRAFEQLLFAHPVDADAQLLGNKIHIEEILKLSVETIDRVVAQI